MRRVHFTKQDEDVEKLTRLMCHLRVLHRVGPDHFQSLGGAIGQRYETCEQRQRGGDWTLGWVWTNVPDPRPSVLYARTLAQPSEHAAGLTYLREPFTLAAHRESVAAGQTPAVYGHRRRGGAGGGPRQGATTPGAEGTGVEAMQQYHRRPPRNRSTGKGGGAKGGSGGAGDAGKRCRTKGQQRRLGRPMIADVA